MTPRDQQLLVGGGLLAVAVGAAYWMERRRSFGAAITPGMSDREFAEEVFLRALELSEEAYDASWALGEARYELRHGRLEKAADACQDVRRRYHLALDALAEARRGSRHPRVPQLLRICSSTAPDDRTIELKKVCHHLKSTRRDMTDGIVFLKDIKANFPATCNSVLPPIPLSGIPRLR